MIQRLRTGVDRLCSIAAFLGGHTGLEAVEREIAKSPGAMNTLLRPYF